MGPSKGFLGSMSFWLPRNFDRRSFEVQLCVEQLRRQLEGLGCPREGLRSFVLDRREMWEFPKSEARR